jgi:hypothetical protein
MWSGHLQRAEKLAAIRIYASVGLAIGFFCLTVIGYSMVAGGGEDCDPMLKFFNSLLSECHAEEQKRAMPLLFGASLAVGGGVGAALGREYGKKQLAQP